MFANPFQALANGDFLPMIVFAILFGLGLRVCIEAAGGQEAGRFERVVELAEVVRDVLFRIVDWILEYAPIGVVALSMANFSLYGPAIIGPYVKVVGGIIAGIALMIVAGYGGLIAVFVRTNPLPILARTREAMLTAFVTRSSAATLPVSLQVAERELDVREEVAAFSLPLGATINMDGVCVHLPMFAVLAANLFGLELSVGSLLFLVITTVLAAIGAGGVPGGSLMLLFLILDNLGLGPDKIAVVVALALGVNPILDMFETMNNVTGDIVCTHVVAENEGLVQDSGEADTATAGA
jgi:Na+/H+-dicarboxylate symporter